MRNVNLFHPVAINAASGVEGKIDVPRQANGLIASMKSGTLDIWFGDFLGSGLTTPHLHLGSIAQPVWVPLPNNLYVISWKSSGIDPAVGCVILIGGSQERW